MQEFLSIPDHEVQDESTSLAQLADRIAVIEATVTEIRDLLANPTPQREWYSVSEVAQLLEKAEFTVREWARLGRVYASKRECGRGHSQEWIISAEEVERIRNEGLLPS